MSEESPWIVVLPARSAFCFAKDHTITLRAAANGTPGVWGLRLRNNRNWATGDHSEGAPTFVGGFVAEGAGQFTNKEAAVAVLGNAASPLFQVMATIANAGVEEPEDVVAYKPPQTPTEEGEWIIQRHSHARSPAMYMRRVPTMDAFETIKRIEEHPDKERLMRAMAHFRLALNEIDPISRVLSAEFLWMAVENLSRVVLSRLRTEHGFSNDGEGKHRLALALGFEPKNHTDRSHLGKLDGYIRRKIVFNGDDHCYKQLKDMSDGFEHGFMEFGEVQSRSKVADRAFALVRRAILVELGTPSHSGLFDSRFDSPIGVWRPALQCVGTYADSAGHSVNMDPTHLTDPWPDPPGLSLVPRVAAVVDEPDGKRTVTLKVDGSGNALTSTQKATIKECTWISPSGNEHQIASEEFTASINGEVVEDSVKTSIEDFDEDSEE